MPKLPTRRCTAAISRSPSLSRLRFSGDSSDIVITSPGRVARRHLLDLMGHPQPLQHHEDIAEGVGVAVAERPLRGGRGSRAGVDADATSAVRPPQRARLTIGVTAWLFRSNVPPRRDNTSRSDRVRTRPDSASSSCSRSAFGCSARILR